MDLKGLFTNTKHPLEVDAGQVIFEQGKPGELMYVVLSGKIDLLISGNTVETVSEGGVFGEMGLIGEPIRTATAIATTPAILASCDKEAFLYMVEQTPFFSLQIMEMMAKRLRLMDEKIHTQRPRLEPV